MITLACRHCAKTVQISAALWERLGRKARSICCHAPLGRVGACRCGNDRDDQTQRYCRACRTRYGKARAECRVRTYARRVRPGRDPVELERIDEREVARRDVIDHRAKALGVEAAYE